MSKADLLVVEDDRIVARDIQNSLTNLGFGVSDVVSSGVEALDRVKEKAPDLVLMDISLKGEMDGIEAASQIHSQFHIPIVYLTAYADENVLERAKVTEPFGYIIKPFVERELHSAIEVALYKHQMEKKLKESEETHRILFSHIRDAVFVNRVTVKGIPGKFIEVNDIACERYGYSRMELLNLTPRDLLSPDMADGLLERVESVLTGKNPLREVVHLTKEGRRMPVEIYSHPFEFKGRASVISIVRDITEQKRAEQDKIQLEKMGALGTLTAGIAHELNNPMMGMLNFIQYCLKNTCKDDKRYPVLEDAERETKRCIEIVRNLLAFSRVEKEDEETFRKESLRDVFDRVFNLLSFRIEKENVLLIQQYADDTPDVSVKVSNIQQVVLNLIANALDALKGRKEKQIRVEVLPEDESVRMSVMDNGCGISNENFHYIFDPFFTTKPPGEGTGLGLSVCHSIVKAHGGKISCESEEGAGTSFHVLLPIEREEKS